METREVPSAHFLIKIECFSLFDKYKINKYETSEFVAGEYKRYTLSLSLKPNKGRSNGGCLNFDYISVNLAMTDTSSLPTNWEVNVAFNIFLFNQISGHYLYSPDIYYFFMGITRRFQTMKFEWGLSKFISKEILSDPSNGYLVNDTCVFGAEVSVECLSLDNVDTRYKHDLKISDFSKLEETWNSAYFIAGGQKWANSTSPHKKFYFFTLPPKLFL
ncbi:hypothetical protein MIMGU_mgv1a018518mg, partial [Erythranthe guttata]